MESSVGRYHQGVAELTNPNMAALAVFLVVVVAARMTVLAQDTRSGCPQPPPGSLASQMAKSNPTLLCGSDLGQPNDNYVGPNNFWDNDAVSHGFKSALDEACALWRQCGPNCLLTGVVSIGGIEVNLSRACR
jgi:hypothetical protein